MFGGISGGAFGIKTLWFNIQREQANFSEGAGRGTKDRV
jgi:hypothetical protein